MSFSSNFDEFHEPLFSLKRLDLLVVEADGRWPTGQHSALNDICGVKVSQNPLKF